MNATQDDCGQHHSARETHKKNIKSILAGKKGQLSFSEGDTCHHCLGQTGTGMESRAGKRRERNGPR